MFITYEELHKKDHIYRTISHVCHNKIVCSLCNFVACDWLSKESIFFDWLFVRVLYFEVKEQHTYSAAIEMLLVCKH